MLGLNFRLAFASLFKHWSFPHFLLLLNVVKTHYVLLWRKQAVNYLFFKAGIFGSSCENHYIQVIHTHTNKHTHSLAHVAMRKHGCRKCKWSKTKQIRKKTVKEQKERDKNHTNKQSICWFCIQRIPTQKCKNIQTSSMHRN